MAPGADVRLTASSFPVPEVYLNANVTEILLNAAGGLENGRLLLVSRGVQGHGIGNQYDVVRRYFMDHLRAVFGQVKLSARYRFPVDVGISPGRGHGPGRHTVL